MAEPKEAIYEVGSVIEFKYRCNGDQATASPAAEVLDDAGVVDEQSPVTLTQIGTTKLWKGSFTPDVVGVWAVHVTDANGGDQVKDFAVGTLGAQSAAQNIVAAVVIIDGKIDTLDGKIDDLAAGMGDAGGAHFA